MKFFKGLLMFSIVVAIMASCSEEESSLFENPHFVSFLNQKKSVTISENSNPFTVNFGMTKVQSQDVTITLQVTDITAIQGTDYTLSTTSVVIPAGEYNSSITITPIDNDVYNESKTFVIEIVNVSGANLSIGNADEYSYKRTVVIANDDCPSQSNIWWGNLSVEDVGYEAFSGTGSSNSAGDCDVLIVTADLPNAGVGAVPFALYFTPDSLGATFGTVEVPSQIYCSACSAGKDVFYSASGTYDETTQTIILYYSLDRSDGANFWTGTNIIKPE